MAVQYYWIGSTGPFKYDDAEFVNDWEDKFDTGGDPPFQAPIVTTGQMTVKTAPSASTDVMRYGDSSDGVAGPPSAVNNAVARWHSTDGEEIQSSTFIVDDDDYLSSFGGRIVFPATMDASSYGHTLDYYAEGTWTPEIRFNLTGYTGVTYDSGETGGFFTRIGQLVHVTCLVTLTSSGSSSGPASIIGLPYTVDNASGSAAPCALIYGDDVAFTDVPAAYAGAGGTRIYLQEVTSPGGVRSDLTQTDVGDSAIIAIQTTYMANVT
jgi:hypothetical protein